MVKINLSGIRYRHYGQGDDDYDAGGPGATGLGDGIELSRIFFRAYQNNQLASIGGDPNSPSGEEPVDTGGGGGTDQGNFVLFVTASSGSDQFAQKTIATSTTFYARADFMLTSAQYAAIVAGGDTFNAEFLSIATGGDGNNSWQGVFIYKSGSNLYFWDYWSTVGDIILITPDVWHTVECAIIPSAGPDPWEGAFRVDGSGPGFTSFDDSGFLSPGPDTLALGGHFAGTDPDEYYVDNGEISIVTWPFSGGALSFSDGFETGNTSGWDSVVGSPTVVATP